MSPITPHTAQIITLSDYRPRKPVVVRLPSWPWGWMMPVVVQWEIG